MTYTGFLKRVNLEVPATCIYLGNYKIRSYMVPEYRLAYHTIASINRLHFTAVKPRM